MGSIGGEHATDAGAALGIVFKVFAIIIAFCLGMAVGAQPIIGYNYGAKKYDRVMQAFRLVIICNIVLGVIATILFEAAPSVIVAIFGKGSQFYKDYAILSFRIYLGGIMFCSLQKASCILLQSINKPYKALFLSLMRDVILLVPGVCLLGLLGNLHLMLWAGIIADVGAFIPTIIFVLFEMRKLKKMQESVSSDLQEPVMATASGNYCITIGREFGSGGKFIGEELAKRLNIKCYDNELITKVSKDFNLDIDLLESLDEKQKSSFWYGFATNYVFSKDRDNVLPISPEDSLFLKQCQTIENLYESESCIIVGRCADFILKNRPNVIKVFVYSSDMQFKIDRKVKYENCTEEEAKEKIKLIDKQRSDYYNHFTSQKWGDKENFDLCVDTSSLGVEEAINIIENYVKKYLDKKGEGVNEK